MSSAPVERGRGRHRRTFEKRKGQWLLWTTKGFAGFGVCRCGRHEYLAGPTIEGKRCRTCVMEGRK